MFLSIRMSVLWVQYFIGKNVFDTSLNLYINRHASYTTRLHISRKIRNCKYIMERDMELYGTQEAQLSWHHHQVHGAKMVTSVPNSLNGAFGGLLGRKGLSSSLQRASSNLCLLFCSSCFMAHSWNPAPKGRRIGPQNVYSFYCESWDHSRCNRYTFSPMRTGNLPLNKTIWDFTSSSPQNCGCFKVVKWLRRFAHAQRHCVLLSCFVTKHLNSEQVPGLMAC